jgi:glycosyltransferase involved in cell wall biosynthesis
MRVLHTIPGRNWGGMEQRTLDQMGWLLAHGHETWLATPQGGESHRRALALGLPVYPFDFDRPWSASTLLEMRRLVRRLGVQVADAHVTRDVKALMGSLDRLALVRSRYITQPLKGGFGRRLQWRHIPDRVIAVAGCIRDQLVASGLADPQRCSVVGEWADESFFAPPDPQSRPRLRRELSLSEGDFAIACVAMLRPDKGQDVLLEALVAALPAAGGLKLLLIGGATAEGRDYEARLRQRAAEAGLAGRVQFLGYRDDVGDLLAAADALAIASIANEAQSRVVPQAFARQKPVVAAATGGLPELVQDGVTGRLVPPGDCVAMGQALSELALAPGVAASLARNGRTFAETSLRFDGKMDETLAAYELALVRAGCRPYLKMV